MSKFIVIYSHFDVDINYELPKKLQKYDSIECEPSFKYEVCIFTKKKNVSFEDVLEIYLKSFNKNDYLGAMSLVYYKYYNELYNFLDGALKEEMLIKKYKRANLKFYRKYLKRWIEFIKRSDDILYPQNNVFRQMNELIKTTYNIK